MDNFLTSLSTEFVRHDMGLKEFYNLYLLSIRNILESLELLYLLPEIDYC